MWLRLVVLFACAALTGCGAPADPPPAVRVAVASNFADVLRALARRFEQAGGAPVSVSVGSTGKLYAQVHQGAPFDLFFAADTERPERLERSGRAVPDSRVTYAIGRLVLWSPRADLVDDGGAVLASDRFRHLAIANPRLAPYGVAAREVLERLGLHERLAGRLVRGENIGQTYQFVATGNADLGFVAQAQLRRQPSGSRWLVPADWHRPIAQQAVLLVDAPDARAFLDFVTGDEGRAAIRDAGYALP